MSARLAPALDRRWRLVPFRARLTLGFAGVMVVLFGGLALLLHVVVENSLDQQLNSSLQARAADLTSLAAGRPIDESRLVLPDSDGTFAQILQPTSGTVLAATIGEERPLIDHKQLQLSTLHHGLINDGPARLLIRRVDTKPAAVLVVGVSLDQRNHTLTVLSEMLFVGGPVLLLLTCLAGYVLAARALAPVERMSEQAGRISGAPAGKRLTVPEARDEIATLGDTLNDLLARVEEALARERSFVSDASHELRTPLAVLKLELEFALASDISREELTRRVTSAAEEVDRLTKVAQDLLFIARADQGRLPLEKTRVEVGAILEAVAARFAQPARLQSRSVSAAPLDGERPGHVAGPGGPAQKSGRAPALFVDADQTWLEQALDNLVSNALRYGDGPVVLTASEHDGIVKMHVLDHGTGFDPLFLGSAFERFARADPARGGVGVGLGLAIVRAIAEAHGGSACAANRPTGGGDVWVAMPASPAPARALDVEPLTERIS